MHGNKNINQNDLTRRNDMETENSKFTCVKEIFPYSKSASSSFAYAGNAHTDPTYILLRQWTNDTIIKLQVKCRANVSLDARADVNLINKAEALNDIIKKCDSRANSNQLANLVDVSIIRKWSFLTPCSRMYYRLNTRWGALT
jgi:hypothetical protein